MNRRAASQRSTIPPLPLNHPDSHLAAIMREWDAQVLAAEDPLGFVARWGGVVELRKIISMVENYLSLPAPLPHTLLDIGCGACAFLRELHQKHPLITYYGLDISPNMIKAGRLVLPSATLVISEAGALPFKPSSFNSIICYSVLHYIPNMEYLYYTLTDFKRVLKPGGRLVLGDVLSKDHMDACYYFSNKKKTNSDYCFDDKGIVFCPSKWLWLDQAEFKVMLTNMGFSCKITRQLPNLQWGSKLGPQRFDMVCTLEA